ncbi:hypothetical protein [Lentibacillus populi]|nr:hypothetical protein [Lentibacillus populi]
MGIGTLSMEWSEWEIAEALITIIAAAAHEGSDIAWKDIKRMI